MSLSVLFVAVGLLQQISEDMVNVFVCFVCCCGVLAIDR